VEGNSFKTGWKSVVTRDNRGETSEAEEAGEEADDDEEEVEGLVLATEEEAEAEGHKG
jgi:hypothetical protein